MDDLFNVKYTKMLCFSLVAEALTGLIYYRPSGENSNFQSMDNRGPTEFFYTLPDREASLIKSQEGVLQVECVPTLPTSDPPRARCPLVKGRQANWHLPLGPWGSASPQVNKPPLHFGGVPSHWRLSPAVSLHPKGPPHNCGRGTRLWSRWLACLFTSPEVGVIWL